LLRRLLSASVLLLATAPARGAEGRGPIESRDEWLLAQPRLTLPATSPDLVPAGGLRLRLDLDWGNDFGWDQDRAGETPRDRRFIVDGEHRTLALSARRRLGSAWEAGLRLPVRWRGPGVLDGPIDWWHRRVLGWLGSIDNGRSLFRTGLFRVEGHDAELRPVRLEGGTGTGLGKLELELRRRLTAGDGWRSSAVARVSLPTGSGPFSGGGLDAGLQVVAAHGLGRRFDVYAGAGGTVFAQEAAEGIEYARARASGFLALEWRPARVMSLLAETSVSSRLVTDLARYPGLQQYLKLGTKIDVRGWTIEAGFTEGLIGQQATTDFGIMAGLVRRVR
jgi:Protein of unknown function (DUF3187)